MRSAFIRIRKASYLPGSKILIVSLCECEYLDRDIQVRYPDSESSKKWAINDLKRWARKNKVTIRETPKHLDNF